MLGQVAARRCLLHPDDHRHRHLRSSADPPAHRRIFALLFAIGKEIYDFAKRAPLADQVFDLGFDIVGTVIACFCLTAIGA